MLPADRVRILHILDAIEATCRFTEGRSRADLDQDEMLLFALVRAVEIAGEAASQLTEDTRAALQDVPWSQIVGMRNRLIHAYFDINKDILWTTITEALPPLAARLRAVLEGEGG